MDRERADHIRTRTSTWDSWWVGLLLVALGVCGFLDAAGIADWSRTIGQWWPLIIVAWAVIDMVRDSRATWWGIVWSAVGIALLADVQEWASDPVVWSALAIFVGGVVLAGAAMHQSEPHPRESRWATWCGWCGWNR